jgi:mono/diheme cytochrome c family protein
LQRLQQPGLLPLWQFNEGARDIESQRSHVILGQRLYQDHCAVCHGRQLEGGSGPQTGEDGGSLQSPPLNASGRIWHYPDKELFLMIAELRITDVSTHTERRHFLAYGDRLSDEQVWDVLEYVKSSWPTHLRIHQRTHTRFTR